MNWKEPLKVYSSLVFAWVKKTQAWILQSVDLKEKAQVAVPLLRNRYVLTVLIFLVWVGFFDQNSFMDRISLANQNKELNRQKEHLLEEIKKNKENMEELRSNSEMLEKFAREEYMMKKPDEDLFIVVED